MEAAVSKTLPLSVLLGRDVPELFELLNPTEDAMVVTTRAQTKRQTEEIARLEEADRQSGAEPNILLDESAVPELDGDSRVPLSTFGTGLDGDHGIEEEFDFDPELFITKEPRIRKTKRVKREERYEYLSRHTQSLSKEELKELQQNDESLSVETSSEVKGLRGEISTRKMTSYIADGYLLGETKTWQWCRVSAAVMC